jgi:hypothetical protein
MKIINRVANRIESYVVAKFRINKKSIRGEKILNIADSQDFISGLIQSKSPFLVARFGTTESRILLDHFNGAINKDSIINLWKLSGVFPPTIEVTDRFAKLLINTSREIDVCGVRSAWFERIFWRQEKTILGKLQIKPKLINIEALSPIGVSSSWVSSLRGLNVLVIHPFADSIQSQYSRRKELFADSEWLPEFKIKTLKSVQSLSGNESEVGFKDWFQALEQMKTDISKVDFDLALVGAGAYGLFIGAHIKNLGKQAIHVGGALQLFFGIKGSRWTNHESPEYIPDSSRSTWIWPNGEEIPPSYMEVESGAYWRNS